MKHRFERYCKDYKNIENYEAAKKDAFKGWDCHHILETSTSDGKRRLVNITQKELIALGMYYNRPAEELIFLTKSEHKLLHKDWLGKHHTEETKQKLREAAKNWTEEHKNKAAEAMKGKHHSDETKRKIGENSSGRHWYNNGKVNKFCFECPEGFVPGRLRK